MVIAVCLDIGGMEIIVFPNHPMIKLNVINISMDLSVNHVPLENMFLIINVVMIINTSIWPKMTVLIFHLLLSPVNNMIKENALPVLMQLPTMSVMEYVFQLEIIGILNIKWSSHLQPPILNSLDVLKLKMMFVLIVLQVLLEMMLIHP